MGDPTKVHAASKTGSVNESKGPEGTNVMKPPTFQLQASMQKPGSLGHCLETSLMSDTDLDKEIKLIRAWIQANPGHDTEMDNLIGELMRLEKEQDNRNGVKSNRTRLSSKEYKAARAAKGKNGKIAKLESPTGHEPGAGGWLEASVENNAMFDGYFGGLLPSGITVEDLKVLSSSVTTHNAKFKELPPPDLWPNMRATLLLIKKIEAAGGITFKVLSGYRSDIVNALSGGAKASAHLKYNGLDLEPQGDQKKSEAFLKNYWFTQGKGESMGLGFYRRGRVHIDASGYRRWPSVWKSQGSASWKKAYQKYYP